MEQSNNSNHNMKYRFENKNLENLKTKKPFVISTKKSLEEEENKLIVIDSETKKKMYKCPYLCGKIFKERGNLRVHIRRHTGVKPYNCNYPNCNKSFISKSKLNLHIETNHSNVKEYICPYYNCNKKYFNLERYKVHLRIHTGEKPYKCNFPNCNKCFNEKGNLKTHYRIHTGEKPFVCNYPNCNASFKAKGHLNSHIKTHFKIKNFKCKVCNSCFSRASTLKKHYNIHFKNENFKCFFANCNREFDNLTNCILHFATHLNFINDYIYNNEFPFLNSNIFFTNENLIDGKKILYFIYLLYITEIIIKLNINLCNSIVKYLNIINENYKIGKFKNDF